MIDILLDDAKKEKTNPEGTKLLILIIYLLYFIYNYQTKTGFFQRVLLSGLAAIAALCGNRFPSPSPFPSPVTEVNVVTSFNVS